MTKDQVRTLCEADDKLQWWAMVLFAEICELTAGSMYREDGKSCWPIVLGKVAEFTNQVIQRQLEAAEGKLGRLDELEARVAKLEEPGGIAP